LIKAPEHARIGKQTFPQTPHSNYKRIDQLMSAIAESAIF